MKIAKKLYMAIPRIIHHLVNGIKISVPMMICCRDEFASKHLVLNDPIRRRLLDLCNYELGDKQECYEHVTLRNDVYATIYNSSEGHEC